MLLPPLFEEANRLRRTLILAMRALDNFGIASILPDLMGQNESLHPTIDASLSGWRAEVAKLAKREKISLIASFRGSALIDDAAEGLHWRCAPIKGPALLKSMLRTRIAADAENGQRTDSAKLLEQAQSAPLLLGGNYFSPNMIRELEEAEPQEVAPLRTVTVGQASADNNVIAGTPLWLRAEPGEDKQMAQAIAADIKGWMASCGRI